MGTAEAGTGSLGRAEVQTRVRLIMAIKALVNSDLTFLKCDP